MSMATTTEILKKINRLHWVWFWSGNWPRLDALTERDSNFEQEFLRLVGVAPRISVDIFKGGIITAYHCQEEYDRMATYLQGRFKKNKNFILRSLSDYEQKTNHDVANLKKLVAVDPQSLTTAELTTLFLRVRKLLVYNSVIDHWAWYTEKFFIPVLQQRLDKRLRVVNQLVRLPEYLTILVTPTKPSQIYKERQAFFRLVAATRRVHGFTAKVHKKQPIKVLAQKYPGIEKMIQQHIHSYSWLSVLVNNPPTTVRDVWEELIAAIIQPKSLSDSVKRLGDNFDRDMGIRKKKLLKVMAFDDTTKILIKSLERTAFIRTEDNAVTSQSSFLLIPLYTEIARRLGITYYELKELAPEEIIKALRLGRPIKKIIQSRYRLGGYLVFRGLRFSLDGDDAQVLQHIVEKKLSRLDTAKRPHTLYGAAASLGLTRGRIFIAMSSKDCNKLRRGDILVAPATSADFVPAMKKAAAIITELGGLTSHAAVIAREFKIPCIVGVETATRVFKTGDRVEVDATNGVVRKLGSK